MAKASHKGDLLETMEKSQNEDKKTAKLQSAVVGGL